MNITVGGLMIASGIVVVTITIVATLFALFATGMSENPWRPMQTAPKDGTLVDLMYPHPRGRTINCSWKHGGWGFYTPHWEDMKLLPESEWLWNTYPNMQPLAWMVPPVRPEQ